MDDTDEDAPIKSVGKAMAILDLLSEARRPLRVSEIAAELSMSASAVSRLVASLSKRDLVQQDEESGRCYLGLGLAVLGANALGRRSLDRIAMPVMADLANRSRGYVSLGRLSRGKVVLMRALPAPLSQHGVNLIVVAPVHACAPGKVLCSGLSSTEVTALLATEGMDPITSHTLTEPEAFLGAVDDARKNGFALDDEETAYHVRHVACPIFDHDGRLVATLSAGGAAADFPRDQIPALIHALSRGCLRISRDLGYTGDATVETGIAEEVCEEVAAGR